MGNSCKVCENTAINQNQSDAPVLEDVNLSKINSVNGFHQFVMIDLKNQSSAFNSQIKLINKSLNSFEFKQHYQQEVQIDGGLYTGQMIDDQRDGYGIFIWPDGARYEGYWQANQMNGTGKLIHAEGQIYDG